MQSLKLISVIVASGSGVRNTPLKFGSSFPFFISVMTIQFNLNRESKYKENGSHFLLVGARGFFLS